MCLVVVGISHSYPSLPPRSAWTVTLMVEQTEGREKCVHQPAAVRRLDLSPPLTASVAPRAVWKSQRGGRSSQEDTALQPCPALPFLLYPLMVRWEGKGREQALNLQNSSTHNSLLQKRSVGVGIASWPICFSRKTNGFGSAGLGLGFASPGFLLDPPLSCPPPSSGCLGGAAPAPLPPPPCTSG